MRLLVQTGRTHDADAWRSAHAAGLVPSATPYGLDELSSFGDTLEYRVPATGRGVAVAAKVLRGVGAGYDWWGTRSCLAASAADVALCWDERSGVPSASVLGSRGPEVISGVIWLTDGAGLRSRMARTAAALRRCRAVWSLSGAQLPMLRDRFGIAEHRLHRLPFGIDVDFWSLDQVDIEDSGIERDRRHEILAIGNDRDRDHEWLVRALIGSCGPDAELVLVTGQEIHLDAERGRRIASLPHQQLRAQYARANVVALATRPNLHVSGMTTLVEAQAMQRPVVAIRTPGMQDYVRDGVTGILVEPGDAVAFAKAVQSLLDDPARCHEMGRAGRRFVVQNASTSTQAAYLHGIISRLD